MEGASASAISLSIAADLASKSSAASGARSSAERAANATKGMQAIRIAQRPRRAKRSIESVMKGLSGRAECGAVCCLLHGVLHVTRTRTNRRGVLVLDCAAVRSSTLVLTEA